MTPSAAVAIVGMGPKGLYALERLLWHHPPGHELVVDVWDPGGHPGAGPVYDPSQPEFFTMNQPAGQIDMWWPGGGVVPRAQRLDFARWSGRNPGEYAPRAHVGRYLEHGFGLLIRHLPEGVTVRPRRASVEAITPEVGEWCVEGGGERSRYRDVLLATGHNDHVDPAVDGEGDVAVRGFALTFIDVALSASEGRGGTFDWVGDVPRYRPPPSGGAPTLWPFSRTGQPMIPKPERVVAERVPGLGEIAEAGLARLDALSAPVRVAGDLVPVVEETAERMLRAAGGESVVPSRAGLAGQMARDLAIALGRARPDRSWALGEAWRSLYPQIAARAAGGQLADSDRPAFRRLAAQMERLAFGPSPVNAAKLLALIDAGVVRLDRLRTGPVPGAPVVEAVIAPPGIEGDPLLERLRRDGHIRPIEGGRGVEVTGDGTCVAASGSPSTGLAAYGRPAEDSVVGNDTLSRTLHPHIDRWAASVVTREQGAALAA